MTALTTQQDRKKEIKKIKKEKLALKA